MSPQTRIHTVPGDHAAKLREDVLQLATRPFAVTTCRSKSLPSGKEAQAKADGASSQAAQEAYPGRDERFGAAQRWSMRDGKGHVGQKLPGIVVRDDVR